MDRAVPQLELKGADKHFENERASRISQSFQNISVSSESEISILSAAQLDSIMASNINKLENISTDENTNIICTSTSSIPAAHGNVRNY